MSERYTVKGSSLAALKEARERLRARLGSQRIGEALAGLSPEEAGDLANDLLALLDAIDAVTRRARPA